MKKLTNFIRNYWLIISATFVLLAVVFIFTLTTISTKDTSIAMVMAERGSALISVFERSLTANRFGRTNFALQELAEELCESEGLFFIALTDSNGQVLTHSDPSKVGQYVQINNKNPSEKVFADLGISENVSWQLMEIEGEYAFTVFKALSLGNQNRRTMMMPGMMSNMSKYQQHNGHMVDNENTFLSFPIMYIFIGQDISLYAQARKQARSMAILGALSILLAGIAALVALQYFQRGKIIRQRQEEAEALAVKMVSKVKDLERDLRLKEKQAAIGDLVAGVAHELRNPLSSIKGYATYFSQLFEKGSSNQEAALIMVQEVERLNRAIGDLIGVSKTTDVKPQELDLAEICKGIYLLLKEDASQKNVTLTCTIAENTNYHAFLDPDRIRQALLNICLNALEAFPSDTEQEKKVDIHLQKLQGTFIITVSDNGQGISADILPRIFDPYFTTKSKGTGLGLVISKNIIEAHKGNVEVESSIEGTKFIIKF